MTTMSAQLDSEAPLDLRDLLGRLIDGEVLDRATATALMRAVFEQQVNDATLGAMLGILRHRGEDSEEIAGFLRAMLERCVPVGYTGDLLVDPVGTGGDGLHTYNISTMTSLVLAGMGIPVAKHGNRKASSQSGSSDALEAAGVPITHDVAALEGTLRDLGLAFLFAPNHHPGLAVVAGLRRELGVMTTFNLLGPLANPAPVTHQLLGVARPEVMRAYAAAAASRGVRAYVVHGHLGADEALGSGEFLLLRSPDAEVETLRPESYGVTRCDFAELRGGTPADNAAMLWAVLRGEGPTAVMETVALNTALMLELTGRARGPLDAFDQAMAAIRSGQSARHLERYIERLRPANGG